MSDENVAKLLDWFARMSQRVERMEETLRAVLESQDDTREILADLRADLRVVKSAVARQDEDLAPLRAGHARP